MRAVILVISSLLAAGARAADVRDEYDAAITRLERLVERGEQAVATGTVPPRHETLAKECHKDFSMPALIKTAASGALRGEKILEVISQDVWHYYECHAYADDDLKTCENLRPFQFDSGNRPELCREFYRKLTLSKSLISKAPDSEATCERLYKTKMEKDELIPPGMITKTCQIIVSGRHPKAVCDERRAMRPEFFTEDAMRQCLFYQGARIGSPEFCDLEPKKIDFCLESVAFKAAYDTSNPERCGKDAVVCQLMMGGGAKLCERYARRIEEAYCRDRGLQNEIGGQGGLRRRANETAALLDKQRTLIDTENPGLLSYFARRSARAALALEYERLAHLRAKIETLTRL